MLDQDPVNPDPKHWVLGPTHLVSAAPGSAEPYIPVGTGTGYQYLLTLSVELLDLQIPVPTYL
jgi:hypothetical protein